MLIKRVLMAALFVLATQAVGLAAPTVFDFAGNLNATSGPGSLTYANDTASVVAFGTASSFGLSNPVGGDATVMKIMSGLAPNTQGLLFDPGCAANGGSTATKINDYTMSYDLLVPQMTPFELKSNGKYKQRFFAFWQTDPTNGNDAEFFIRGKLNVETDLNSGATHGLGVSGMYPGDIVNNEWTHYSMTVHNSGTVGAEGATTSITETITGASGTSQTYQLNLVNSAFAPNPTISEDGATWWKNATDAGLDSRWALNPTGTGNPTWIFGDNDGDSIPAYVRSFSFDTAPVPEPSSFVLLAVAALSALGYCWRKR
jgi:hypothetical protein